MTTDTGQLGRRRPPSMPVEVSGFVGTRCRAIGFRAVGTEARAREIADYRARQKREIAAARQTGMRGSLEQMMNQLKSSGRKEFPLIRKGDVQGST